MYKHIIQSESLFEENCLIDIYTIKEICQFGCIEVRVYVNHAIQEIKGIMNHFGNNCELSFSEVVDYINDVIQNNKLIREVEFLERGI